MVNFQRKQRYGWEDLLTIMHLLRAPEGCPWDREQTHQSIRRNFLEETYEALDAIDRNDTPGMCEELGDVLLQVAEKIVSRSVKAGFNWDSAAGALDKLDEETAELRQAVEAGQPVDSPHGIREELGDALFILCKIAQMSGVDPEDALHRACDKYQGRFRRVADAADRPLNAYTEAEKIALWEQAKEN